MTQKVTISQVAKACGTSIGTVDRALNRRSGISIKTRELVLETAEKMGYRTNKLAGALSRKNLKRIAIIYPSSPEDFYECMEKGIEKAREDISIYGVEIDSFRYGVNGSGDEKRVLEALDAKQYDAVALDPLNEDSTAFVDRLNEMEKPVALFNNDLPRSSRLFFVGGNSLQSGKVGGDIMGFLMGGKGTAAVLGNFVNMMPYLDRFEGFCQTMNRFYPDIKVRSCPDCRHDEKLTEQYIRQFLDETEGEKGIFCTGYSCTVGAVKAIKKIGRNDIPILGYDVSNFTAQAVRDGSCRALLYQDPCRQAYMVLELLSRNILENRKPVSKQIFIPGRIVFRQNIDDFSDGILRGDLEL